MTTVQNIFDDLNKLADVSLAEKWDNVGLMLGSFDQNVEKILVCLDVTTKVVEEAKEKNIDLIISHHPLIFKALKSLNFADFKSNIIKELIKNDIAVISLHTNLDSARLGLNDFLAKKLKLNDIEVLFEHKLDNNAGLGRYGKLSHSMNFEQFIKYIKSTFDLPYVNVVSGNKDRDISTVAILGGSGGDFIYTLPDVDIYLTGDVTYHVAQDAIEMKKNIVDIGHFSEHFVKDLLLQYLQEQGYKDVEKSEKEQTPFNLM